MIRNFFITAVRNVLKYRAYSLINFTGLTCGLALALLIFTYVRHETSYDRFHEKGDRLFRLSYTAPNGLGLATSPPPISPQMKAFFPEVEESGRLFGRNVSVSLPGNSESFEETNVFFADSSVMKMFTFDFVDGDARRALHEPFTVILTDEMARKYFGDRNAVGESLLFGGQHLFKVVAVVRKYPESSHISFNMLVPYENMFDMESDAASRILRNNLAINFIISHSYTYVLLKPGATPKGVNDKMEDFLKKHANPQFLVGQVFTLMPVHDIHLRSTLLAEPSPVNTMGNIYIFISVGLLTLVIACINYVNLSTAQSLSRVKEIGVRKILGSQKSHLIVQFLAESFLFCMGALCLAFIAFYATLPMLNMLTNKQIRFVDAVDGTMFLTAAAILVIVTILAGGYPAWFVTRFESVSVLKSAGSSRGTTGVLRKSLVVFQLAIACMLLSGAMLIVRQLGFLAEKPLGFEKEMMISVPLFSNNLNGIFRQNDSTFRSKLQHFRKTIERETGVTKTTLSSAAPGLGAVYRGTIPEGFSKEDHLFVANLAIDYDFIDAYGMKLVAGRGFSEDFGTDLYEAFIVNETAVREFKWMNNEDAIGKTINREGKLGKVIGVVRDFHFASLTTAISGLVMEVNPNQFNSLSVRFDNPDVQGTIEKIRLKWSDLFPEKTFEYTFLDQQLARQYENFSNFGVIVQVFTFVAILISCLGVYGLVLFVVQRKVKEIGVRKVLGANEISILKLICIDFVWLVGGGFVLAIPVSAYFLDEWLQNFTYRTSIDVLTYLTSLAVIAVIVGLTISFQAFRAAIANPVHSLRSE
jgi:putative ABC transport system permease protein